MTTPDATERLLWRAAAAREKVDYTKPYRQQRQASIPIPLDTTTQHIQYNSKTGAREVSHPVATQVGGALKRTYKASPYRNQDRTPPPMERPFEAHTETEEQMELPFRFRSARATAQSHISADEGSVYSYEGTADPRPALSQTHLGGVAHFMRGWHGKSYTSGPYRARDNSRQQKVSIALLRRSYALDEQLGQSLGHEALERDLQIRTESPQRRSALEHEWHEQRMKRDAYRPQGAYASRKPLLKGMYARAKAALVKTAEAVFGKPQTATLYSI